MLIPEFGVQLDVLYNSITSNQAPGLNGFEKSLFLTKAEKEITKNYCTAQSKGNTLGQGFDDSAKRQADFSVLMKAAQCLPIPTGNIHETYYLCTSGGNTRVLAGYEIQILDSEGSPQTLQPNTYNITVSGGVATIPSLGYTVVGYPYNTSGTLQDIDSVTVGYPIDRIDDRSLVYSYPSDVFIVINETLRTTDGRYLQIEPLRYDTYADLMSKPFKRPLKNQAWRLMNSANVDTDGNATKYVELITNSDDVVAKYSLRYIRVPKPIIVEDLPEGLTIDGESTQSTVCEIDPILHDDIVQRAVELAKIAWTNSGQENVQTQMMAGQRTE